MWGTSPCGVREMADEEELEDETGEDGEGDDGDDESSEGQGSKKKLFLIIGIVALLVVGGLAAAYFTGLFEPLIEFLASGEEKEEGKKEISETTVFFPLEELIVNLNTGGRKSTFLKVRVSLELDSDKDVSRIEAVMPRIMDNFQVYLRELRVEDLKGSAGMFRLREELLTRVNAAIAPAKVNNILFKEMLVQ